MTLSQPENNRKKLPDECVLTIKFRWDMTKQYSFHTDSDLRSWYLSPQMSEVKDSLVIAYKDGCRVHFPLTNIESYHVAPRQKLKIEEIYAGKVKGNAEIPPAVRD